MQIVQAGQIRVMLQITPASVVAMLSALELLQIVTTVTVRPELFLLYLR